MTAKQVSDLIKSLIDAHRASLVAPFRMDEELRIMTAMYITALVCQGVPYEEAVKMLEL